MSLCRSQIRKLLHHLLRRMEVKRCLLVGISKAFSCHNNSPVHLVFRIEKMHIAGRHHRLLELLPQPDDLSVQIP